MATLKQIVIDCRHPAALARFWAEVLDDFEIRPYDDAEIEGWPISDSLPKPTPV